MTTLVIGNVDDDLMNDLSSMAASNRIDVEMQARLLLRRAVPPRDRRAFVERLNSIAAMTPLGISQADSLALLREDRKR